MTSIIFERKISQRAKFICVAGISIGIITFLLISIGVNVNFHCSEHANVVKAIFDFTPDPEETFEASLPLIFTKPYGYILRTYYFSLNLIAFVLFPSWLIAALMKPFDHKYLMHEFVIIFALVWVNCLVSEDVQGERLKFISYALSIFFTFLSPLYVIAIKKMAPAVDHDEN